MLDGALIVFMCIVGIALFAIAAFYILRALFVVIFMVGAMIYNLFKY